MQASVFDVNSLVFSALNEERQKVIEQVRIVSCTLLLNIYLTYLHKFCCLQDSTEHAISFLQNKTDQEFYLELANKSMSVNQIRETEQKNFYKTF